MSDPKKRTGGPWWMTLLIIACVGGVAICVFLITSDAPPPGEVERLGGGEIPARTSAGAIKQSPARSPVGARRGLEKQVHAANESMFVLSQPPSVAEEKKGAAPPVHREAINKEVEGQEVRDVHADSTGALASLSAHARAPGQSPGEQQVTQRVTGVSAALANRASASGIAGLEEVAGTVAATPLADLAEPPDLEALADPAPTPEVPVGDTGRVAEVGKPVVDFIIGGSHSDPRRRMVGWNIVTQGWAAFIRKRVNPYLESGVTRIILHNPFGILPGESMQLDQYLNALDQPGLRMLTGGFAKVWKPVTARGVEVIAYVGCPRLDKDATRIDEEEGRAAGMTFSLRCIQPALDAGMSIGLDASAPADGDSLTWDLANYLRSQGVKVYVEARPYAEMSHWFDFPVICIDHYWRRSDPDSHADSRGAANDLLTGEILRMVVQYQIPGDWEGTEAGYMQVLSRTVQSHGHTPIVLAGSKFPPEKVAELSLTPTTPAYD